MAFDLAVHGTAAAQVPASTDKVGAHPGALPDTAAGGVIGPQVPMPVPSLASRDPVAPKLMSTDAGQFDDIIVENRTPGMTLTPGKPIDESDQISGFTISAETGEPIDALWVRRQFAKNGLLGHGQSIDRALILVNLINATLLKLGHVNSGLLLGASDQSDILHFTLVFGQAQALEPTWIKGHRQGLTAAFVTARLPSLRKRPFNAKELERDFRLLSENDAMRSISMDLRPGDRPGEANVAIAIDPAPRADFYFSAATSRSPAIGGERYAAGGSLRNLLFAGDLLGLEYGNTSGRSDGAFDYRGPVITPETLLTLRAVMDDAAVIEPSLRPLDIRTSERAYDIGLQQIVMQTPLAPALEQGTWYPAQTLAFGARISRRVSRTTLLGEPFSFSPGATNGRTAYTALRLTADYLNRTPSQVVSISFVATTGLDGTRSDVTGLPSPSRDFKVISVATSFARRLDRRQLELRLQLSGQWANGLLYADERLSVGGEFSVRGYRQGLLLADTGVVGSIQLARPFSISGGHRTARGDDLGAFVVSISGDAAAVGYKDNAPSGPRWIASTGISLSWTPMAAFSATGGFAQPLRDVPISGQRDFQDRGFSVRITFRPLLL